MFLKGGGGGEKESEIPKKFIAKTNFSIDPLSYAILKANN